MGALSERGEVRQSRWGQLDGCSRRRVAARVRRRRSAGLFFFGGSALALLCLGGAGACRPRASVVISEFVASNTSGLRDEQGDTSDWIELYNPGSTATSLEGWCLTDQPEQLDRWCFPDVSISPRGYLVVFASGKQYSPGAALHATFKLKASEDFLALVRPGGAIAHAFAPYPDQKENVAFGLTASGSTGLLGEPTPGAPNR